jgi:hypothetical protein
MPRLGPLPNPIPSVEFQAKTYTKGVVQIEPNALVTRHWD